MEGKEKANDFIQDKQETLMSAHKRKKRGEKKIFGEKTYSGVEKKMVVLGSMIVSRRRHYTVRGKKCSQFSETVHIEKS